MRKRFTFALFVMILCLVAGSSPGSAQARPLYALAFAYDEHVRVGTVFGDGSWRFYTLGDSFFGAADAAQTHPVWSPDGHKVYTMVTPPDDPEQSRFMYVFDILTEKYEPVVFLRKAKSQGDAVIIDSLSPDGRYALLARQGDDTGRLIDVQGPADKRVVVEDSCPAYALAWGTQYLVIRHFLCSMDVQVLDIAANFRVLMDIPETDPLSTYDQWYELPGKPDYLLAAPLYSDKGPANVVRVEPSSNHVTTLLPGKELYLTSDKTFAGVVSNGSLIRLNLSTMATENTGPVGEVSPAPGPADALVLWEEIQTDSSYTLNQILLSTAGRKNTQFYQGPLPFMSTEMSPDGRTAAVWLGDVKNQIVEIYSGEGRLWSSQDSLKGMSPQYLAKPRHTSGYWSPDGRLYFFAVITSNGDYYDLALEFQTGKTMLLPEAYARIISMSPDNVWWLYDVFDNSDSDTLHDKLIAFNPTTGASVKLIDGDGILLGERDFHFDPQSYYVWSPPLEPSQ